MALSLLTNESRPRILIPRAQAVCLRVSPRPFRSSLTAVPSLPVRRDHARVKPEETPSHGSGLSDAARERLDARRRERNVGSSAVSALKPERDDDRKGLGDFQSRANRAREYDDRRQRNVERSVRAGDNRDSWGDRGGRKERGWDDGYTPRGSGDRDGPGSMRVPNRGWDETPRRGAQGGDEARRRAWDETPRGDSSRGYGRDSPGTVVNGKEWEEEQVRLDRDWYSYDDEGQVVSCT